MPHPRERCVEQLSLVTFCKQINAIITFSLMCLKVEARIAQCNGVLAFGQVPLDGTS